ncbi:MAG TPA: DNA cytosine methyltransferase [Roseiflexaceae bacterium]|nr:DNA cytosine methyltransferase [Roseiflexaceae bacterium]
MDSIELFTGAGGLALGTHRAGFNHLAVVEWDQDSCDTLSLNTARRDITGVNWPIHCADVRQFDFSPYQRLDGIDLLAGGAPCQPFSLGGKHAGESDPRNMFPAVFRAVRALRPRAIILENVRGLLRESFRPYFNYIVAQLARPFLQQRAEEAWWEHAVRLAQMDRAGGQTDDTELYDVAWQLVNVADYGVPQERHRVFIVAFRHDLAARWAFPAPTHSREALLYAQHVDSSYWSEHGIDAAPLPERFRARIRQLWHTPKPLLPRWRTVRDAISDLPEPVDYVAHPTIDNHMGIPDARSYPGHTGSPWNWPAKAIKAGDHGNPGGENMLRRDDHSVRYFTVRELARLQTFPDTWHFANSWTENRRQLGNAVPVHMAERLAAAVHAELLRIDQRARVVQV